MSRKTMNAFIADRDFPAFVDKMIASTRVVGPVAKHKKFEYADVKHAEDLRLDFDVTILPPKAVFFPPEQRLLEFDGDDVKSCIDPVETVLFGVHFYDVKGIDILDELMSAPTVDGDYLSQRAATTIVASNIQNVSPWAFWDTVGQDVKAKGMDAFLTKIDGGYVFETFTDRGTALTEYGAFTEATPVQQTAAKQANDNVMGSCEHRLHNTTEEIKQAMDEHFGDKALWEEVAEGCFSCGSCNLVCPTCFCFDVQDRWNLDQTTGNRTRFWDSCLACDFASTTLAGGGSENFRGERYERFRHRFMRKTTYLNDRVGGPACTGCGRCAGACTAGIADPVKVINTAMEVAK